MQHKETTETFDTVERERERESHSLHNQGIYYKKKRYKENKQYLCGR